MDHQGFTGVTDADSLGLGVENDIHCHIKVCRLIHIDVTVSRAGLDDRYCAVLHHSPDKSRASPGDQYIHIFPKLHESCCGLP